MFQPLEKKRFSDRIVELIKAKIIQENLKIGTRLPSEIDLSQEFSVSRSVIREALRILEISGLVSIKKGPSGGIFVSNVYHKPIKDSLSNLILRECGIPLLSTSANFQGEANCLDYDSISSEILEAVDLALDAGSLPSSSPSTILNLLRSRGRA